MASTLRDVADRAGVSPRTVSNVINDFPHVSAAMRARVQAAITELDYRPNLLARSLRSGRTGLVTLLVPEIRVPYFAELAHELIERARAQSMTVLIDETGGLASREQDLLDLASRSRFVDGVLLSSLGLSQAQLARLRVDVPVVLLGEQAAGTFDHVGIDNVAAARTAVEHLLERGARRVALIGWQPHTRRRTGLLRHRGYVAALEAAGLPVDPDLTPETSDYHRDVGAECMRALLALPEPPDAVFCCSDTLALGALRAVSDAGLRVPQDVALVGFDDVEEGRYSAPRLTSVSPDKQAIASTALRLLDERVGGLAVAPRDVVAGHRLEVRESSGGPA